MSSRHERAGGCDHGGVAAGTPVIASPYGAAPEIITHGLAGFVCTADAISAVDKLDSLSRRDCREGTEERLYQRILGSGRLPRLLPAAGDRRLAGVVYRITASGARLRFFDSLVR